MVGNSDPKNRFLWKKNYMFQAFRKQGCVYTNQIQNTA
uniref:Uncharacterized protein n=1 Tax=Rhizophora mucronata TaxID=61149 RepID=A0A2P2P9U7_RHIMU